MSIHNTYCPNKDCQGGYIRSAVFDSDTQRWMPTDYICNWVPSEKLKAQLCQVSASEAAWERRQVGAWLLHTNSTTTKDLWYGSQIEACDECSILSREDNCNHAVTSSDAAYAAAMETAKADHGSTLDDTPG